MIVMKQLQRVVREYNNNSEIIGMRYLSISISILIAIDTATVIW